MKNSKKWEKAAEMREKHLLVTIELHFCPAEDSSPNQGVIGEHAFKETLQKSLRDRRDRISA